MKKYNIIYAELSKSVARLQVIEDVTIETLVTELEPESNVFQEAMRLDVGQYIYWQSYSIIIRIN